MWVRWTWFFSYIKILKKNTISFIELNCTYSSHKVIHVWGRRFIVYWMNFLFTSEREKSCILLLSKCNIYRMYLSRLIIMLADAPNNIRICGSNHVRMQQKLIFAIIESWLYWLWFFKTTGSMCLKLEET